MLTVVVVETGSVEEKVEELEEEEAAVVGLGVAAEARI
jgi:hypothetical protein